MSRKDPANFGTIVSERFNPSDTPDLPYQEAVGRSSTPMPERVLLALLRTEVDRLSQVENEADLRRVFNHIFAEFVSTDEIDSYVTNFQRTPPLARLGYPRSSTEMPCYSVVLESDPEGQGALGSYLGQTQPGDPAIRATEYVGGMYGPTYGVYGYAEHPDVCVYMYHIAKAIFIGSYQTLEECGITNARYDGSDMSPQDAYIPENMFVRRLGVTAEVMNSSPLLLRVDPARVRIVGLSADDIVLSGIRGGVHSIDPSEG